MKHVPPQEEIPTTTATGPNAADATSAHRRLQALAAELASGKGTPEHIQSGILTALAELLDADAVAFVTERDGSLAVRDLALDARHRAAHLAIGNEFRMAASEVLRTSRARTEPSRVVPAAVLLATPLVDGRSVIAAIKAGSEKNLSSVKTTLELAALAMNTARSQREAPLVSTLSRLMGTLEEATSGQADDLATRLASAFGARLVLLSDNGGAILATAPKSTMRPDTPAHGAATQLIARATALGRPIIERAAANENDTLAHQLSASTVVALPMGDEQRRRRSVLILVEPDPVFAALDAEGWRVVQALLAPFSGASPLRRERTSRRPSKKTMLTALALAVVAAALFIPVPDRIRAEAELEPESRNFVSASFSGVLREAKVKPGDVVTAGDTIATLEGEALALARNTAAAKAEEAFRRRDAAIREKRVTEAELARNEGEAAAAERDLLDWQLASLELKAPVDGVVLASPLEQSAGAPVREGDVIAEIAPLARVRVRFDVPVESLARMEGVSKAALYMDGAAANAIGIAQFTAAPEAETIGGRTVLPLRAAIDNPGNALRPGQRGVVVLPTGTSRLGDILFRDAWIALRRWWR